MLKDKLRELRECNRLKQKDMARILNITTSCYSNYEQGTREPSIEILKKICDYYDIDLDALLDYKKPSDRMDTRIINNITHNNGTINNISGNNGIINSGNISSNNGIINTGNNIHHNFTGNKNDTNF